MKEHGRCTSVPMSFPYDDGCNKCKESDIGRDEAMSTAAGFKQLNRLWAVLLLSVAFGYIEAAVVVYLRVIYYPEGFTFPLPVMPLSDSVLRFHLGTEIGREAATLVLITGAAWLAGQNRRQQIGYFLLIFAVWDIFYYIWLKVLLGWPASILDWDILFLIPTVWASAVLYPLLVSLTMAIFGLIMLYRDEQGRPIRPTKAEWLGFVVASALIVTSFCTAGPHVTEENYQDYFYWPVFASGWALGIGVFMRCLWRSRRLSTGHKPEQ